MLQKSGATVCWLLMMTAMYVSPTIAAEPDAPWDQAKAIELTKQLSDAIDQIFNDPTVNKQQPSVMKQRKHDGAMGDFELLREEINILSQQLAEGKGHSYTLPVFKHILSLRKNIRTHAKDTDIEQSIREKAKTTASLLKQLKALYQL